MVPDPRDGVGVWRCSTDPGMSVIVNANTLTLETLIDLCEGKYGAGPTCPDHIVIALNCSWGTGDDVGQFWQRYVSHCPPTCMCAIVLTLGWLCCPMLQSSDSCPSFQGTCSLFNQSAFILQCSTDKLMHISLCHDISTEDLG
jgi:hypothetical protein